MKKNKILILPVMLLLSFSLFTSCQEDVQSITGIDNSLPEIKAISTDIELPLPGDTIQVSVTAAGSNTYQWTANAGSFLNPTSNPASWVSPDEGGTYRVTCRVTNTTGSRKASKSISVFAVKPPPGAVGYWPFDLDFNDYNAEGNGPNNGSGDDLVSIDQEEFVRGIGSALFEGEDGADNGQVLAGGAGLDMGTNAEYAISFWLKTEDEFGFLVGKTVDGEYVDEGSKCLYVSEGNLIGDIWGIGDYGWEGEGMPLYVSDGEWHHIVWNKGAYDEEEGGIWTEIWFDGEFAYESFQEGWSEDGDRMFTIGAAWEGSGEDWPGAIEGNIDDVAFYPYWLDEEDIVAIFEAE